jgi:adenylosuccinate lyase
MPHKMNSRSCERINGFHVILSGYVTMAEGLAGDQWNEGDVSCSVVRRVMLPDSFFTIDSLLETTLVVLNQMEVFTEVIQRENARYLPFLATTTILMAAIKAGAGREQAHAAIKEHAVQVVRDLRGGAMDHNDLVDRLAHDPRLGLDLETLQAIVDESSTLTGMAGEQVDAFCGTARSWLARYPTAATYRPGSIL